MNTCLAVALLLVIGSVRPTGAQQPSPPDPSDKNCEQEIAAIAPHTRGGHAAVATVIQVDHAQGLLHLETDLGRLLTFATPEDIKDVQEGDQLKICIAEAEPADSWPDNTTVN